MYRDEVTLWDVWKAANNLIKFTSDLSEDEFYLDEIVQSAILHQFMVLGEAVKRISPEYREAHTEIPWKEMAGMRDKLIHFYEGVDLPKVWKTIHKNIPSLIEILEPLVPKLPEE